MFRLVISIVFSLAFYGFTPVDSDDEDYDPCKAGEEFLQNNFCKICLSIRGLSMSNVFFLFTFAKFNEFAKFCSS